MLNFTFLVQTNYLMENTTNDSGSPFEVTAKPDGNQVVFSPSLVHWI